MTAPLDAVLDRLRDAYGRALRQPVGLPHGEPTAAALVAAVLAANTEPRKVEVVIHGLREAGLLDLRRLYALPAEELAELLRPAGRHDLKAKRLRGILRLAVEQYEGDLEAMFAGRPEMLRDELLAVSGIGPEIADAILLYAGNIPRFPVNLSAHRVLARHGWIEFDADYETIRSYFEGGLEPSAERYNEYRELLDRVGKEHCRSRPICDGCPLSDLLPEDRSGMRRPLEPESFA